MFEQFKVEEFMVDLKKYGWKVHGWKVYGWMVHGLKVQGWNVVQPFWEAIEWWSLLEDFQRVLSWQGLVLYITLSISEYCVRSWSLSNMILVASENGIKLFSVICSS